MLRVFDAAVSELREYFSLREAEERGKGLDSAARRRLAAEVRLSRQKRVAAETLFDVGQRAEALQMASAAFALLASHRDLAGDRRSEELEPIELPVHDEDVREEHDHRFHQLVERQKTLQQELADVALDDRTRGQRRLLRGATVVSLAFAFALVAWWWSARTVLTAEASSQVSERSSAANAVDGVESTQWVLPDKTVGYLDVKVSPAQRLVSVTMMNGWDPPSSAVRAFRLEAYDGATLLKSQDGELLQQPGGGAKPSWTTVPFVVDHKVNRVRIVVKSTYERAGALAVVRIP